MNSNISVLYVEDDQPSQKVMQLLLESIGVRHVYIFGSSENFAMRLHALDPQPNIILLDIHISPKDGFEMLKIIRRKTQYNAVPTVALTASVMNEEVLKLKQAGFDGAISKPINLTRFPSQINELLAGNSIWHIGD